MGHLGQVSTQPQPKEGLIVAEAGDEVVGFICAAVRSTPLYGMEFTAGALVAKYTRAGARAVFVHLTAGEMGHPRLSDQEYARQTYEEAHNAAQVLGADTRGPSP